MLVEPKLAKSALRAQLEARYALTISALEFLPIGNDAAAWCYRVEARTGAYFLKLRKGALKLAALQVPRQLQRRGIKAVAPIVTESGTLYASWGEYALILYPYIEGKSGWNMALTPAQWRAWGLTMRAIHQRPLARQLRAIAPREVFAEKWLGALDAIEGALAQSRFAGDAAAAALLWRRQRAEITQARQRYCALGRQLAAQAPAFVLCHADIHRANIILDKRGAIHIVDWDETLLAPKERDLMFFVGEAPQQSQEADFLNGYGSGAIDMLALAYYRYDWALQEFADYGERLFLAEGLDERELRRALTEFERLFAPGDVLAQARQAYARRCQVAPQPL